MPSCIGRLSASESIRPREMSVPSDGGEEVIAPRVAPVPAKPTQTEQDEHCATGHAAYRSWCEHCVKGRGRISPHAVVSEGVARSWSRPRLPGARRIQSDNFGVQVQTHWVPGCNTGAREGHQCLSGWLRDLGWKRLLLRSDNERALLAFLRASTSSLEGVEVIEQASPEGDHAANGLAQVGVREVKAQTRVLKSHLEERLKRQLDWSEPLATWLVRH